jgi:hypothetical protein
MKNAPAKRVAPRANPEPVPRVFRPLTLSEAYALWKEKGGATNGSARAELEESSPLWRGRSRLTG